MKTGCLHQFKAKKKFASASLKGIVLWESDKYEIVESNVYFPPKSVNWQYFIESGEGIVSPAIGRGIFYTISVKDLKEKNGAWSFPEPKNEFRHIKDYVAFGYGVVDLFTEMSGWSDKEWECMGLMQEEVFLNKIEILLPDEFSIRKSLFPFGPCCSG